MYTKTDYRPLKEQMLRCLKSVFKENPQLRMVLERIAKRDSDPSHDSLLELEHHWDNESGHEFESKGCYRFHLVLNFTALAAGKDKVALGLYVSHVPQTDNGYDWSTQEIDKHKANPFKHRPFECNAFLARMDRLRNHEKLTDHLKRIHLGNGVYKSKFIKALEPVSELRYKLLVEGMRVTNMA